MGCGEEIKLRRKTLAISQRDLAEMAGVGLATIKDIERGKGNPSLSTISRILDVLGMEVLFRVRQTVWNEWWDNWMYIWMTERPVYWLNGILGVDTYSVTMRTTWLRMALKYQSRCRNWGFLSNRRFYFLNLFCKNIYKRQHIIIPAVVVYVVELIETIYRPWEVIPLQFWFHERCKHTLFFNGIVVTFIVVARHPRTNPSRDTSTLLPFHTEVYNVAYILHFLLCACQPIFFAVRILARPSSIEMPLCHHIVTARGWYHHLIQICRIRKSGWRQNKYSGGVWFADNISHSLIIEIDSLIILSCHIAPFYIKVEYEAVWRVGIMLCYFFSTIRHILPMSFHWDSIHSLEHCMPILV